MADFNLFNNDICLSNLHIESVTNCVSKNAVFFDEDEY